MRHLTLAFLKAILIVLLGLFGTVAGSIAAVFLTPAGRGLAGRTLSEQLDKLVEGDVTVGSVGGPLWGGLAVDNLVIRDTTGTVVLEASRLGVSYRILEILAGRIRLFGVTVTGLRLELERHRNGKWNVASILRSNPDTTKPAGPPPLLRFEDLTILDARVRLLQPWDPADSMRAPAAAAAALAEERARPGRVIEAGPEGYRKVVVFDRIGGRFQVLQISSPTNEPLHAEFDSLAARVSDPQVDLRAAKGKATLVGDRLSLDLSEARLPASQLSAVGTVILKGPRFDLKVIAPQVALNDLRGFVPGLPDLAGSGSATLLTRPNGRLAADVTSLDIRGRQGRATGRLTAVTGANLPLGFERLDLNLIGMDPQAMRGWLDTIPLTGTLDGRVRAEGLITALDVDADVIYRDRRVAGRPANHLSLVGRMRLGGAEGMVFDTITVRESDLDMSTIRVLVPSNPLAGRVAAEGTLVGPWQAVTWRGTALHRDGERPVSVMRGTVFLNTRTALPSFNADVGLTPLVLDGLVGTWPALAELGDLRGGVKLQGTSERFAIDADLHGKMGHFVGTGIVQYTDALIGFDSLDFRFDSLDLSAFSPQAPRTQLIGAMTGGGQEGPTGRFDGRVALAIGAGWIREVPVDSGALSLAADPLTITVDTAFLRWPGGKVEIGGTLARQAPASGSLRINGDVADLGVLDSLVEALYPTEPDTLLDNRHLSGRAQLAVVLTGAVDSLAFDAEGAVRDLVWRRLRLPAGRAEVRFGGGAAGAIGLAATIDTATWEGWSVAGAAARADGVRNAFTWSVASGVGPTDTIVAGGRYRKAGDTLAVALDSLTAVLTAHTWRLAGPAAIQGVAQAWRVDSLVFLATDGSGELRFGGALPSDAPGDAKLTALGLDLRDVMGLFQRDTIGVLGRGAADITFAGTAKAPLVRGTFSLSEGGYRDFRAPYLQGALNYADKRLEATLLLWRTGRPALTISADTLPLDLSFTSVRDRKLPGPLYIRATADSADLGLLEAFTQNLRRVRGSLTADLTITGGWNEPVLGGTLAIADAAATLPGLGVRWERTSARVHLAKDSVVFDELTIHGGAGSLSVASGGWVRFERGRSPTLSVRVRTERFRAIDVRNFLTLVATTQGEGITISGPVFGATLTGRGTADEGALYFADLVTKQIVDLSDPATADLIDTALVRSARLGPSFQNQFIDSLRIQNFRLTVGEDFWLRSTDANIKLSGGATVNKLGRNYRVDGTLTAERGQYVLKMGITRNFDVERGSVRFLGTPDLNAELDLTARHQVKPTDGTREFAMQARITGTLLVPKLTLMNSDNPSMTETDMVSYLMFGRSTAGLQGAGTTQTIREQAALSSMLNTYFLPALSSELERTLISDLGVPVDYIQIRPGGIGSSSIEGGASGLTTLSAGWQLGRRTFVSLNAGICNNNATDVSYHNFGASLEQRLHKDWRVTLSVEPVFSCSTSPGSSSLATSSLYQLGLDLLWDREY